LEAGDFESLAAADVGAGEHFVAADHVGLGFGEAGTIAFIGVAGKLGALFADDPVDLVFAGLAAMWAGEGVGALFAGFVEKFAFFHGVLTPEYGGRKRAAIKVRRGCGVPEKSIPYSVVR
jgi:hypothetical protein